MLVDRHHHAQILALSVTSAVLTGIASTASLINTNIYRGAIAPELSCSRTTDKSKAANEMRSRMGLP